MSDLSLSAPGPRAGYAAGRRRSPAALTAAIALNGGAFALILLMPATKYIIDHPRGIPTMDFPIDPTPPETKPTPVEHQKPVTTQKPIQTPDDPLPYVPPPVAPIGGDGAAIGGTLPSLGGVGDRVEVKPAPPPHVPIFAAATRDPRYAAAFHPDYPPALRRQGLEGSVTVRVTIDESGRVTACELVKATDKAFFEETKAQALRYWRFRPATSDGAPVASQQVLTVHFQLEDE